MSDNIPTLTALRGGRTPSDAEYIEQLEDRVIWLRRAYGKAWLRRRSMSGIIRDVNDARLRAKAERRRLREWLDTRLQRVALARTAPDLSAETRRYWDGKADAYAAVRDLLNDVNDVNAGANAP